VCANNKRSPTIIMMLFVCKFRSVCPEPVLANHAWSRDCLCKSCHA
jgi:hypothetical protein